MNIPRFKAGCVFNGFKNQIVIGGGRDGRDGSGLSIERYDMSRNKWIKLPNMKHKHA